MICAGFLLTRFIIAAMIQDQRLHAISLQEQHLWRSFRNGTCMNDDCRSGKGNSLYNDTILLTQFLSLTFTGRL